MNILFINDDFTENGGIGVYLRLLIKELLYQRHKVAIITSFASDIDLPGLKKYQVEDSTNIHLFRHRCVDEVLKICYNEKPDVIHINALSDFYLEHELASRFKAIKTIHNLCLFCPGGHKLFWRNLTQCKIKAGWQCFFNWYFKTCNCYTKNPYEAFRLYYRSLSGLESLNSLKAIIVTSQYLKDCLVQNEIKAAKIHLLPYFTTLPEGLDKRDENIILFVGRIYKEKGLEFLLEALCFVDRDFRLLVIGDGLCLEEAKDKAARLGLAKKVEFLGWKNRAEVGNLYQKAKLVVIPSIWQEPFAIVGIEAMSYGRPVVAFAVGGIAEWLEDGVTGFLIQPYDIKEMANKINYLLEHSDLACEMGSRGRKRAENNFNQKKAVMRLLEIYREVIGTQDEV